MTDIISGFLRETYVIDTPMRKLSVLESHSGQVTLRDVAFIDHRSYLTQIFIEPEQAHTLASVLLSIEATAAGDAPPKMNSRRVRA